MRKLALLSLFALLVSVCAYGSTLPCNGGPGSANTFNLPCYFYAGDFDPNNPNADGLANENDALVGGNPYGAATYQNFYWQDHGTGKTIVGLFTNNITETSTPTAGYWEIRSGVSEGNGGTLIASGTETGGNFSHRQTGRGIVDYTEWTDAVKIPAIDVADGQYWYAVVPVCTSCQGRTYNTNTFDLNKIGKSDDNLQYFNSSVFGANFTNANNEGPFPALSGGVLVNVPESGSFLLLGTGILGGIGVLRRKLL